MLRLNSALAMLECRFCESGMVSRLSVFERGKIINSSSETTCYGDTKISAKSRLREPRVTTVYQLESVYL